MTTLAVVAVAGIPAGKQLSDSAPQVKGAVQADQYNNVLVSGYNPQPLVQQLSGSAPSRWSDVQADTDALPTREPIGTIPQGLRVDLSAPQTKTYVCVDQQGNRLPLSVVVAVIPQGHQLSDAAPQAKYSLAAEQYNNILVRGYNPQPQVKQLDQSATARVSAPPVEQPANRLPLVQVVVQAPFKGIDAAPPASYQIQVDAPQRPLTLGITTVSSLSLATTSYALTIDDTTLIYAPGGVVPPPPVTETPAGRNIRLTRYIFKVDGREFQTYDLSQALAALDKAKQLAKGHAREIARKATDPQRAKIKPIKVPVITGNRALAKAVEATKLEIRDIYASAIRDAEIAMWIEIKKRNDEDEDVFLLMI
jgi:hypothetical protein